VDVRVLFRADEPALPRDAETGLLSRAAFEERMESLVEIQGLKHGDVHTVGQDRFAVLLPN
jgi:hypothetical protein